MIKILIINAQADVQPCISGNGLASIEAEIDYCSNLESATKKISESGAYQIVIADSVIKDHRHNQNLNQLIIQNPLTKIILIFDAADMDEIRAFKNMGMYDFLLRPVHAADLRATLKKAVREIQMLSDVIDQHDQLVHIEQELEIARSIQHSLLKMEHPCFPEFPAIDIYGNLISSREVGGDFFDTFMLDGGRLGIVIGDVSGKGLPAALEMARIKVTLQALAVQHESPGACLAELNKAMFSDGQPEMPVAVFYAIVNTTTGSLCYSNAGIEGAYYLKRHRNVRTLNSTMHPLTGAHPASLYQSETLTLSAGESLVLYSDGLVSTLGPKVQETFPLLQSGNGTMNDPAAKTAVEELLRLANRFPPSDDLTCLVLHFKGSHGSGG